MEVPQGDAPAAKVMQPQAARPMPNNFTLSERAPEPEAKQKPMSPEEAIRVAAEEGLQLVKSEESSSGFKGVLYRPSIKSKPYLVKKWKDQKHVLIGSFSTAEEGALCYARYLKEDAAFRKRLQEAVASRATSAAGPSAAGSPDGVEDELRISDDAHDSAGNGAAGGGGGPTAGGGAVNGVPPKRARIPMKPYRSWTPVRSSHRSSPTARPATLPSFRAQRTPPPLGCCRMKTSR